jgi:outer membrane protein OmpA-like peptidoglycan-associated protein
MVVAVLLLFSACAPTQQSVAPTVNNPRAHVAGLERAMANARTNQVNLLAPTWYGKAEASLEAAKKDLAAQAEISRIAEYVANGKAELRKAEEIAAVSRTTLTDVINRREMARKAGAASLKNYQWTENDFLRLTKEIEKNNLGYAMRNRKKVAEAFRDLEITAIKSNLLGEVRTILKSAERSGAKKYAPKAYAAAVQKLNATDAFISANPYEVEEMTRRAKEALFYARRADELTQESKKIADFSSEQITLQIENILYKTTSQLAAPDMRDQKFDIQLDNITGSIRAMQENQNFLDSKIKEQNSEIEELGTAVMRLEGKTREEQMAKESLEAEKRFNEKFQEIQTYFTKQEAEVYRQGDQLVIRLRGMQFPIGKAVIMPENYALLSKVQQALRSFKEPEVIIEGHTDSTGSANVNEQLSQERAEAVKEYLIANKTMPESSLFAIGYGSSKPLMSNETTEGRAANRRIDMIITPQKQ